MNTLIKNEFVSAEIADDGAEVVSFKKLDTGSEYIWNGDKTYWTGHSPVLFPIVCALKNGEAKIGGEVYKIGNHGFAKKSRFHLVESGPSKAVFRLIENDSSLSVYPFKFRLDVSHTLVGSKLTTGYSVTNTDNIPLYFQIGTHPGFNCPLESGTVFEDYYIEFGSPEKLERLFMDSTNVIITGKSERVPLVNDRILPLKRDLFNEGAMVMKKLNSTKITLKSDKTARNVVLEYVDMPNMGIWQTKNAPFICIEPWHGAADTDDFTGEFKEKDLMLSLEPGAVYTCRVSIEIH